MKNLTNEEVVSLINSNKWKSWTDRQVLMIQLYHKQLCVPFKRYCEASRRLLDLGIYNKRVAREKYEALFPRPTERDIDELLNGLKIGKRKINMEG